MSEEYDDYYNDPDYNQNDVEDQADEEGEFIFFGIISGFFRLVIQIVSNGSFLGFEYFSSR